MKVLIVCSYTSGIIPTFVEEQVNSLKKLGIEFDYHFIRKKGLRGYFLAYLSLLKILKVKKYDLIHGHYGFSGLVASLQTKTPTIITFHGSDVNQKGLNFLSSKFAEWASDHCIFVNKKLAEKLKPKNPFSVISCGVDLEQTYKIEKSIARTKLNLNQTKKYVLFSSSYDNFVKNYPLAKRAMDLLPDVELIELKNYTREEVTLLMNASDCLLVTSFSESGPLVVKEALCCGCPVVSVDVGDVKDIIESIDGCYITSYIPSEIAGLIKTVISENKKIDGGSRILEKGLEINFVAKQIEKIYFKLTKGQKNIQKG